MTRAGAARRRVERKTRETDIAPRPRPRRRRPLEDRHRHRLPRPHADRARHPRRASTSTSRCKGDLHVDAHHTVEDVGIALGDALRAGAGRQEGHRALRPRLRAARRGAVALRDRPLGPALAALRRDVQGAAASATMPTELFEDFFWALADHGRLNLHLDMIRGRNAHHIAETLFKSTARALSMAVALDPRVTGVPEHEGHRCDRDRRLRHRQPRQRDQGVPPRGGRDRAHRRPRGRCAAADALVLPGDGAFGATMDEIESRGLVAAAARGRGRGHAAARHLHRHAAPVRGERGARPSRGPRPPARPRAPLRRRAARARTWAGTALRPPRPHPLLDGVADGAHVYFVHSYYCDAPRGRGARRHPTTAATSRPSSGAATCWACSSIPEKSQARRPAHDRRTSCGAWRVRAATARRTA